MQRSFPYGALPLIGGLAVITLASVILFVLFSGQIRQSSSDRQPTYETSNPLITKVENGETLTKPKITDNDPIFGNPSAKVSIIVFSDFSCPYCKVLAGQLKSLVETNDNVRLVWKDFPITAIHPDSGNAHIAAQCAAEQGKFWEYHDSLFATQKDYTRSGLQERAQQIGLNVLDFSHCLDSTEPIQKIASDISEGQSLNIDGTPYIFVNDQRVSGLVSNTELEQIIKLHSQLSE